MSSLQERVVLLFCLPPHTTQDSQPLDCTVFGPLKRHWSDVCHEFQQHHPGMVISKLNFSGLFAKAWLQALTPANIIAGFRKCGVHPFNRNAIPIAADDSSSSGLEPDNPSADLEPSSPYSHSESNSPDGGSSDAVDPSTSNPSTLTFISQRLELFETRFSEGYDIYVEEDYVAWLKLNHPNYLLGNSPPCMDVTSLLDNFSDVSPLTPLHPAISPPKVTSSHQK